MNNPAAAFITILEIELKDLEEDIQLLMANCEVKRHHEEISNYVYLENVALLQKELFDVDGVIQKMHKLNPADFGSEKEVSDFLLGDIRSKVERQIIPPVIISMVERKFDKVSRYLEESNGVIAQ
ncbi:MAG: hypothetical protein PQJ60_07775 [Spirochaetales bacterium]|nr:hypothetical protein [Spirochaetales bacterium]